MDEPFGKFSAVSFPDEPDFVSLRQNQKRRRRSGSRHVFLHPANTYLYRRAGSPWQRAAMPVAGWRAWLKQQPAVCHDRTGLSASGRSVRLERPSDVSDRCFMDTCAAHWNRVVVLQKEKVGEKIRADVYTEENCVLKVFPGISFSQTPAENSPKLCYHG